MIFNMIASGGGASAPRFGIATAYPKSYAERKSFSFNGLLGEPQAFCVILVPSDTDTYTSLDLFTEQYIITHFVYDGIKISTATAGKVSRTEKGNIEIYGNGYNAENNTYSFVYSNGTLTVSVNSNIINNGYFYYDGYVQYELLYIY